MPPCIFSGWSPMPPSTLTCTCSCVRASSRPAHLRVYLHVPTQLYWNVLGTPTMPRTNRPARLSKHMCIALHAHAAVTTKCIYIHKPMHIMTYEHLQLSPMSAPVCPNTHVYTHAHTHTLAHQGPDTSYAYACTHIHITYTHVSLYIYPRLYMTITPMCSHAGTHQDLSLSMMTSPPEMWN